MSGNKRIKTALVSVYHKDGLDEIITKLHQEGVKFISTGGTQTFIESLGIPCDAVEDLTSYPSILGGRVKTLHPKVFGGILCRRDNETDNQQISQYEIPEIDLNANLKRPMLFYTYDLEKYRDVLRGFYIDMENELPGPLLFDTDQVVDAIENIDMIKIGRAHV